MTTASREYFYAIRGTAGSADIAADLGDIVMDGLAMDQIVDMYNHWQRINTSAGQTYQIAKLVTIDDMTARLQQSKSEWDAFNNDPVGGSVIPADLSPDALLSLWSSRTDIVVDKPSYTVRRIQLSTAQATESVIGTYPLSLASVTGHSLGGHLATAFTRLFPNSANAITINGAGYPTGALQGLGGFAQTNIRNLFGMLGGAATFDANAITNVHGDGLNMVSMNSQYGLVQQGANQEIYIETVTPTINSLSGNLLGHGAGQMTDSLAVYNLFAQLDPQLNTATSDNINKISNILKSSSNVSANSLESVIAIFGKLLKISGLMVSGNQFDSNRNALYQALDAIYLALPTDRQLQITDLSTLSIGAILASANTDIAYRYALSELSPFALSGLNKSNYAVGDALDMYDPATQTGCLSVEYLTDRSKLLQLVLKRNLDDISSNLDGSLVMDTATRIYTDSAFGINILPQGADVLPQEQYTQVRFGNDDNEVLKGGFQDDRLYGMVGDDTLQGGLGNDHLEGGRGFDTYQWNTGDGNDTIFDSDKLGQINVNGQNLSVANRVSLNKWRDARNITYTLQPNGSDQDLLINTGNSSMRVQHFKSGDLGITLSAKFVMPYFVQNNPVPIQGDMKPFQYSAWNYYSGPHIPDTNLR